MRAPSIHAGSTLERILGKWTFGDAFGRLNESARAQFLASRGSRRGVRLSLLSDVATAYFQLLELDEELEIASRTTNSFAESLENLQPASGRRHASSALESSRAEAAFEDAATAFASNPATTSLITENQLQRSIWAEILERLQRPGLVAAARTVGRRFPQVCRPHCWNDALIFERANNCCVQPTRKSGSPSPSFSPKIGLTALLGKVSRSCRLLLLAAPMLGHCRRGKWPVVSRRPPRWAIPAIEGCREEARLRYQQTILNAFREVSDALVAREQLAEVREHQAHQVSALEQAVKLSSERYVAGKASYYEVLEAQQQLFPSQLNLARAQRATNCWPSSLSTKRSAVAGRIETNASIAAGDR